MKFWILSIHDILKLVKYTKTRNRSIYNYYEFEKINGDYLYRDLMAHEYKIKDNLLLDLGCGFGGYSSIFQQNGARVIGLDKNPMKNPDGVPMVKADAFKIPFHTNQFDWIICSSLIEHLDPPGSLLLEAYRVLKPGGKMLLSYPPFYSLRGGHQFSPFHLLGQRLAIAIYNFRICLNNKNNDIPLPYIQSYKGGGLYKRTINQVNSMIGRSHFTIVEQSTRWFPIDFSKLGWIGEFLTWHVQFLLKKL